MSNSAIRGDPHLRCDAVGSIGCNGAPTGNSNVRRRNRIIAIRGIGSCRSGRRWAPVVQTDLSLPAVRMVPECTGCSRQGTTRVSAPVRARRHRRCLTALEGVDGSSGLFGIRARAARTERRFRELSTCAHRSRTTVWLFRLGDPPLGCHVQEEDRRDWFSQYSPWGQAKPARPASSRLASLPALPPRRRESGIRTHCSVGAGFYMSDSIMSFSAGCIGAMASAPGRSDGM